MGAAVFAIWIVLEPSMNGGAKSVLETALAALPAGQKALWLAFRVAGSIIIIPWVEELAFRGYLLRRLAGQHFDTLAPPRFTWGSFILSSLAFGLLHTRWLAGTLAGMIYALAFYRRGKLGDAITAHMVSNGLIALSVLAGDRWSFWS
jgi:CAAX prenyl protease-like protein